MFVSAEHRDHLKCINITSQAPIIFILPCPQALQGAFVAVVAPSNFTPMA